MKGDRPIRAKTVFGIVARMAYLTLYNPNDRHLGLPENEFGLLSAFYDNAAPTVETLRTTGVLNKHVLWINDAGELWPDYYAHLPENKAPRGRTMFPAHPDGTRGNGVLFTDLLRAAVDSRKIPAALEHRASRLVVNARGETIRSRSHLRDGRPVTIRARKAVVFGSGGFTANPELCLNFLRGPIFGGCTVHRLVKGTSFRLAAPQAPNSRTWATRGGGPSFSSRRCSSAALPAASHSRQATA